MNSYSRESLRQMSSEELVDLVIDLQWTNTRLACTVEKYQQERNAKLPTPPRVSQEDIDLRRNALLTWLKAQRTEE